MYNSIVSNEFYPPPPPLYISSLSLPFSHLPPFYLDLVSPSCIGKNFNQLN